MQFSSAKSAEDGAGKRTGIPRIFQEIQDANRKEKEKIDAEMREYVLKLREKEEKRKREEEQREREREERQRRREESARKTEEEEEIKEGERTKAKHMQAFPVKSELIKETADAIAALLKQAKGEEGLNPLGERKVAVFMFLSKKMSQIGTEDTKVRGISSEIYRHMCDTCRGSTAAEYQYMDLLVKKVCEQAHVQVAASPNAARGYALLLGSFDALLKRDRSVPVGVIEMFKMAVFCPRSEALEYCVAGHRIYFLLLVLAENKREAWEYISSLLNFVALPISTANPYVLDLFIEVLGASMSRWFGVSWQSILEYVRNKYLPLLGKEHAPAITRITQRVGGSEF